MMRVKRIALALCLCLLAQTQAAAKPQPLSYYKTLQNTYTKAELNLIYRVVETETFTADIESKSHVASVIFNMINDKDKAFGRSVSAVIKYPNRFAYCRKKISTSTKQAVHKAFTKNTAPGCVAFHSGRKTAKFAGFKYSFTDEVGHHFYK